MAAPELLLQFMPLFPQSTFNKIVFNVLKGDKEWVTYNDSRIAQTRRDRPNVPPIGIIILF
eukprot:911165-Pleurochrysis_carterae.AAC.1